MVLKFWFKHLLKRPLYVRLKRSYQNELAYKKNVIFVHVPKAAGTSIHMSLFGRLSGFGHSTAERYLALYGPFDFFSSFRFSFVRNPYDRFVSTYEYLRQGGNNSNDLSFYQRKMACYDSFEDFVLNGFSKDPEIRDHIHFKKQSDFIYSEKKCLVDFIGRFENLETDYKYIKSIVGAEHDLVFVNKTTDRQAYEEYFRDPVIRKIIFNYYKEDFENFFYESGF